MTISEEKKTKILDLYNKGISKKDISRLEEVSYPSIRSILEGGDTEQIKKEKKRVIERKLTAIFNYEDYTDETVVNLIFNLKRIGMVSGRDLGQFIEDIEVVFDAYHKITENPIKLFDFLLDVSNELALITDHITAEVFFNFINEYIERARYLNELEAYISEQKQNYNELFDVKTIELKDLNDQIFRTQEKLDLFKTFEYKTTKAFMENLSEEKLKKALERIAELELDNQFLTEKSFILENETKQPDKKNEIIKRENLLYRTLFEKIKDKYPNELKKIVNEIDVENNKQKINTAKDELTLLKEI